MKSGAYLTTQCRNEIHESVFNGFQLLCVTPRLDNLVQVVMRPDIEKGEQKGSRDDRGCSHVRFARHREQRQAQALFGEAAIPNFNSDSGSAIPGMLSAKIIK